MKNSVTIISDGGATGAFVYGKTSTLWAEDVEHCIGELCKAVGARYDDAADVHEEDSYGYEWKGAHGSVYYETDEDKFHLIQVDFECDAAVMERIMQIENFMSSKGCVATYYDANGKEIDLINSAFCLDGFGEARRYRNLAIAHGWSYLVTLPTKHLDRCKGDDFYLEKYFATLDEAKYFMNACRATAPALVPWARICYMLDNGKGASCRYQALRFIGQWDFVNPSRTLVCES